MNPQAVLNAEAANNTWLSQHMTTGTGGEYYVSYTPSSNDITYGSPSVSHLAGSTDVTYNTGNWTDSVTTWSRPETTIQGDGLISTTFNGATPAGPAYIDQGTTYGSPTLVSYLEPAAGQVPNPAASAPDMFYTQSTTAGPAYVDQGTTYGSPTLVSYQEPAGQIPNPAASAPDMFYTQSTTAGPSFIEHAGNTHYVANGDLNYVANVDSSVIPVHSSTPIMVDRDGNVVQQGDFVSNMTSGGLSPASQVFYSNELQVNPANLTQITSAATPTTGDQIFYSRDFTQASFQTNTTAPTGDLLIDSSNPQSVNSAIDGIKPAIPQEITSAQAPNGQAIQEDKRPNQDSYVITSGMASTTQRKNPLHQIQQVVASMNPRYVQVPPQITPQPVVIPVVAQSEQELLQAQASTPAKSTTDELAKWKAPVRRGKNGNLSDEEWAKLKQDLDEMTQPL
jgi:hypothetical protein